MAPLYMVLGVSRVLFAHTTRPQRAAASHAATRSIHLHGRWRGGTGAATPSRCCRTRCGRRHCSCCCRARVASWRRCRTPRGTLLLA